MRRRVWLAAALLSLVLTGRAAAQTGVTDTEIVVGCSTSFSGPMAFVGEQVTKFGLDLYFKAVNDAGGIHGRRIRTVYYDDGYHPHDAVTYTKKLVETDHVFAVIAPLGTPSFCCAQTKTSFQRRASRCDSSSAWSCPSHR